MAEQPLCPLDIVVNWWSICSDPDVFWLNLADSLIFISPNVLLEDTWTNMTIPSHTVQANKMGVKENPTISISFVCWSLWSFHLKWDFKGGATFTSDDLVPLNNQPSAQYSPHKIHNVEVDFSPADRGIPSRSWLSSDRCHKQSRSPVLIVKDGEVDKDLEVGGVGVHSGGPVVC